MNLYTKQETKIQISYICILYDIEVRTQKKIYIYLNTQRAWYCDIIISRQNINQNIGRR